jgi:uncharacterized peroxidase-related enzyme
MAFIKVIQPDEANGALADIYKKLLKSRGKLAEVHKIQSLNPESIVKHMDLYMELMYGKSPLRRYQREMIGVVVSLTNKCEYCQIHHLEALKHFWKDSTLLEHFISGNWKTFLSEKDLNLCLYAENLTREPHASEREIWIDDLKKTGCDDRQILDATLVVSYFNFVNRVVLGLGVDLEKDAGGFKYD